MRRGDPYAETRRRPLLRRRLSRARPARVRMRARKPCLRLRRRTFGWYVRFMGRPEEWGSASGREITGGRRACQRWKSSQTVVARNGFESRKIDQGRQHIESTDRRVRRSDLSGQDPLIYKAYRGTPVSSPGVYKVGFVSLVEAPRQPIYSPSTGSIDCLLPALGGPETVRPGGGVQIGEMGLLHRCGYSCGEEK